MANNPNVNKVVYGNQTVMDISDTTAEEGDVVTGKTFYKANGARSTGSAVIPDISNCYQTTDTAETDLQDTDYVPFYDISASGKRKTLWSNIKAKLKAYFDTIYSTFSGSYNDLTDKPTIPAAQIQSDWNQTSTTAKDFIKNKPTIPAAQIQSDWNQTTTTAKDYIKNKPTIYKKGVYYGTCTSQAANQTKAVTIAAAQGFTLEAGATIYVKFDANNTYTATSEAPVKLNVNSTGAKNVYYGGSSTPTGTNTTVFGRANYINQYIYDGTYWVWQGSSADNNTTYSAMSVSELTTGTATTARSVRADYLKSGINSLIDTKINALDVTGETGIAASKTVKAWSETNGKVSLTTQDISITKSQVSDFPDLSVYAPLASPAFTGTPTAPTASSGTNTTQIATTAFVHTACASKYDYNDPYLSSLSDTYTYVPVLDTTGMYATKRTSWQNVKQTLAADLSAVFLVRTSVTASAGSEIRIPASGTSPYLGGDPYIEPVCDTGLGRGVKYSEIWVYGGSNNEGYVKIKLAEAISGSTIGVKIIRR